MKQTMDFQHIRALIQIFKDLKMSHLETFLTNQLLSDCLTIQNNIKWFEDDLAEYIDVSKQQSSSFIINSFDEQLCSLTLTKPTITYKPVTPITESCDLYDGYFYEPPSIDDNYSKPPSLIEEEAFLPQNRFEDTDIEYDFEKESKFKRIRKYYKANAWLDEA